MATITELLSKTDSAIIGAYDKGTTFLQKRGIIPLNTVIMANHTLFWTSIVAANRDHNIMWFFAVLAAVFMFLSYNRWQRAIGYWENARKMMELNARVIVVRGNWWPRLIGLTVMLLLAVTEIMHNNLIGLVGSLTVICINYLDCCTYLGPGDYAKNRQSKMVGQPQEM